MTAELQQRRLMDDFPFASMLGLELEALTPGHCLFGLNVDAARHHNPQRAVHGSVLHALADTAMGMALYTTLDDGQWCATIEIKVSYLRAVGDGRLSCEAQLVHRGKATAHLEARVRLGEALVATSSGSFAIFPKPGGSASV